MARTSAESAPLALTYSKSGLFMAALLIFFILGSALSVIYTKHLSRQYFAELQSLQKNRDNLHMEWSQLLLEQGTWATDVRVERVARERLKMNMPNPDEIKVIR